MEDILQDVIEEAKKSHQQRLKDFCLSKWQLFTTAALQVTFVAANVTFIAQGKIIAMLLTGFMISLIWTLNIKRVAFGGWSDRIVYATGAMVGTGVGYYISHLINSHI